MTRIRLAQPADAAQLVALAEQVGGEPGGWLLSTEWRAPAEERRYLKAALRSPDAAVFVAEDEEALVVGRLSLARDPHPASAHVADLGMMVAAGHRRRGVGRALLDAATGWAETAGVRKLELHVFPWNAAALGLYESFGFVRVGTRSRHYVREGEEVDAILMELPLRELARGDERGDVR